MRIKTLLTIIFCVCLILGCGKKEALKEDLVQKGQGSGKSQKEDPILGEISRQKELSPYLTELQLSEKKIGDISALKDVISLKFLILDKNNINDVSPLSKLGNLKQLFLSENKISDEEILDDKSNQNVIDTKEKIKITTEDDDVKKAETLR